MRRVSPATLLIPAMCMLLAAGAARAAPVCVPIGDEGKQQRCEIRNAADCDDVNDYPYARNLYCPAAFNAAQAMVSEVAKTLGVKRPEEGFFFFYQTPPDPDAPIDDQPQTTTPCMNTPAPYPGGSKFVVGAGEPLCHLVAHVTSPGPDDAKKQDRDNPVPKGLRSFPEFFGKLYSPDKALPLTKFKTGSAFDPIVIRLGASAHDGFTDDYKKFSETKLYLPDKWAKEDRYRGISGGGGGGWGGEIAIAGASGPVVLLAFGGGGGGGMTSSHPTFVPTAASKLGAGGGGGVQFANGYVHEGEHYNGLGLGAGMGSGETEVQYSYNDYEGSGRAPKLHEYNAPVIADYEAQLKNLADQLKSSYKSNKTVVVRGGGGMGAGTEYLTDTGQEYEPHALSTQAGFQFSYVFRKGHGAANDPGLQALDTANANEEDLYAFIGDAYRIAARQSFEDCDRDYSNFACMCPRQHAVVICLVKDKVGDPAKIPAWLQQRHCPDDAATSNTGFTRYQQLLLDASIAPPSSCMTTLEQYFTTLNTPVDPAD